MGKSGFAFVASERSSSQLTHCSVVDACSFDRFRRVSETYEIPSTLLLFKETCVAKDIIVGLLTQSCTTVFFMYRGLYREYRRIHNYTLTVTYKIFTELCSWNSDFRPFRRCYWSESRSAAAAALQLLTDPAAAHPSASIQPGSVSFNYKASSHPALSQ